MLIRQTAPVFGAANPYQAPGETQVSVSVRELRSYTHYSFDVEQVQREQLGTNVINQQRAIDLTVTHRNRKPDPYTGAAGDATFPKYIILASYGFTFGGRKAPAATTADRSE